MHLLSAKTSWQNVQEEAIEGSQTAHEVIQAHKKHHTVPVQTLRDYLTHLASSRDSALESAVI
jgi:hypothetical protein